MAQPAEEAADTDNTDKLAGSTNINPVADSDSELQLLKEENAYLKQQIVILQKMVDEHKNCTTQEGAGISGKSNLILSLFLSSSNCQSCNVLLYIFRIKLVVFK